MTRASVGLDVGGANLKAAHSSGPANVLQFALWKHPDQLPDAVAAVLASLPDADALAVTMTGELCDCWENKRQGVSAILDAVLSAARGRPVHVWSNQGRFLDVLAARARPLEVASANWLALAGYAGRFAPPGFAVLADIGTTTADLVPLKDGKPVPRGRTDPERLACGELVYRGWKRTPLCCLVGPECAAEFFATMHDVYLYLTLCPEDPADLDTADGRPATADQAANRLARMLLQDEETATPQMLEAFAREMHFRLCGQIAAALGDVAKTLCEPVTAVLGSGSGEFLLPAVLRSVLVPEAVRQAPVLSLADRLGPATSAAACAYAVAVLCAEQEGGA